MGLTHEEFQAKLKRTIEIDLHVDELNQTLGEQIKRLNEEATQINRELVDYFMVNDIQNINAHGKIFYLNSLSRPKIVDLPATRRWLDEKGDLEFLQTINSQKFGSYYRELEEAEEELPPGVEVFIDTSIKMRKGG